VIRVKARGGLLIGYVAQERRPPGVPELDTMDSQGHNSNPSPLSARMWSYDARVDVPRTKLIGANMVWCWTSVHAKDINVVVGGDRKHAR
jgi:hypothetical protein